jgi:hypothetical protein
VDCSRDFSWTRAARTNARAQTYDPSFPVCIQTYGYAGNNIDRAMPGRGLRHLGTAHQQSVRPGSGAGPHLDAPTSALTPTFFDSVIKSLIS